VQQSQVVIGVVQDHFDRAILEQRPQSPGHADRQGIDHGFVVFSRQLQQVHAIDEAMEAGASVSKASARTPVSPDRKRSTASAVSRYSVSDEDMDQERYTGPPHDGSAR
jgi:hypothetical protein